MHKIKDVLRLKLDAKLSHQQIAAALSVSKGVVTKYVGLAAAAGLDWAQVQDLDETGLERLLLVGPERCIGIRNMGVDHFARLGTVLRIDVVSAFGAVASAETLFIRRRRTAVAPVHGEWVANLDIDEIGQAGRIRLIPYVPGLQPRPLGVIRSIRADPRHRGVPHAAQRLFRATLRAHTPTDKESNAMATSITDEEWDELSPENFEAAALLRAVDAVDELRGDLNDNEDAGPPQLRTDLLKLHQLAMAVFNEGSRSQVVDLRVRRRSGRPGARHNDLA